MKSTLRILATAAILLLAASCGQDTTPVSPQIPTAAGDKLLAGATGYCNSAIHNELEGYWNNTQGVVFGLLGTLVDLGDSYYIDATPPGWAAEGKEVSLTIPKTAMPAGYDPHDIMVAVPMVGPVGEVTSVPYHFFPDGIQFEGPITVKVAWPGWAGEYLPDESSLVYVTREYHDGDAHYRAWKQVWAEDVQTAPAMPDGSTPAVGCSFQIDHFSRWNVSQGTGDDGVDPPIGPLAAVEEPQLEEVTCWTPRDPDDGDPLPLIR